MSREKHYIWSVYNFRKALLRTSDDKQIDDGQYKIWVWRSICWPDEHYRSKTIKKRFFKRIYQVLERYHFGRAFKSSEAPKTNLRESYHASYVKGRTVNLTLLDAEYRNTASAVKLKQSMKMFGLGYKCQGSGPILIRKTNCCYERQKSKVKVIDFLFVTVRQSFFSYISWLSSRRRTFGCFYHCYLGYYTQYEAAHRFLLS